MNELNALQKEAFDALRGQEGTPCFLRVSLTDDALWVCDLPRKTADTARAEKALEALGIRCFMDEKARLWRLDATEQRYAGWNAALPPGPPALPESAALHRAYALCRLLCLHPAPLGSQPKEWIRGMLKRGGDGAEEMEQWVGPAHAACAALLRRGQPLPAMAGGLLAQWLERQTAKGGKNGAA